MSRANLMNRLAASPDQDMGNTIVSIEKQCEKWRLKMPRSLPFAAAIGTLRELVDGMVPGEELVLTVAVDPKAIVTNPSQTSWPYQPGTAKDTKHWMPPDIDAQQEDFAGSLCDN